MLVHFIFHKNHLDSFSEPDLFEMKVQLVTIKLQNIQAFGFEWQDVMLTLNNVSGTFQVCPTSAVFLQSQNSVSYFSTGSNIGLIDSAQAFTFTTSSTMVKWISIITSNSFKTYGAKSAALQSKSNNAHFLQSRTYKVGVTLSYFNNKTYFQIVMSKASEFKLAKFTLIKKQ